MWTHHSTSPQEKAEVDYTFRCKEKEFYCGGHVLGDLLVDGVETRDNSNRIHDEMKKVLSKTFCA